MYLALPHLGGSRILGAVKAVKAVKATRDGRDGVRMMQLKRCCSIPSKKRRSRPSIRLFRRGVGPHDRIQIKTLIP